MRISVVLIAHIRGVLARFLVFLLLLFFLILVFSFLILRVLLFLVVFLLLHFVRLLFLRFRLGFGFVLAMHCRRRFLRLGSILRSRLIKRECREKQAEKNCSTDSHLHRFLLRRPVCS